MEIQELQDMCTGIKRGEYVPLLDDLLNGRAMIVDTNWLAEHDKQMIDNSCEILSRHNTESGIMISIEEFRKAMEQ